MQPDNAFRTNARARALYASTVIDNKSENPGYHQAPHCDGGRTYNFRYESVYDDAICYANTLMNDGFSTCMREVSKAEGPVATQSGIGLYQTALLTHAQESAKSSY